MTQTLSFKSIGEGPSVVFLHAFPMSGEMWNDAAEAVSGLGFRAIIPDFPGFGSTKGLMVGIRDSSESVLAVLELLDIEKAVFCGLSMGGYVAFDLLRIAPERFEAAVFCDTNATGDSVEKRNERLETIEEISEKGSEDFTARLAKSLISPKTRAERTGTAAKILECFEAASDESLCAALESMAKRESSEDLLAKIDFPVQLIYGSDDVMLDAGLALSQQIPHSGLAVIEGAGHFANLEAPDAFNSVLGDFLKRHFAGK